MIVILSGRCSICIATFPKMNGTPEGQHSVHGVGWPLPLNSSSPYFLRISAASDFRIGFVWSPTNWLGWSTSLASQQGFRSWRVRAGVAAAKDKKLIDVKTITAVDVMTYTASISD